MESRSIMVRRTGTHHQLDLSKLMRKVNEENPMNIAVLEDNPAILEWVTIALEMSGHHVHAHTDSSSLLETLFLGPKVATPLPYDCVLVDLLLPKSPSGLETIHCIRQAFPAHTLPIIIISALDKDELERVRERLPEVPIFRKPFKMSELLDVIVNIKTSISPI